MPARVIYMRLDRVEIRGLSIKAVNLKGIVLCYVRLTNSNISYELKLILLLNNSNQTAG